MTFIGHLLIASTLILAAGYWALEGVLRHRALLRQREEESWQSIKSALGGDADGTRRAA